MDRKTLSLCLLLVGLGGVYVYRFTDWFAKKAIQVSVSFRPLRQAAPGESLPVVIGFDEDRSPSSLSVMELDPAATNRPGRPVWKLVSGPKSVPTRGFLYGDVPEGMKELTPPGPAAPLKSGALYRVEIHAGGSAGLVEFLARSSE
jgi:hypothetical protein